jgi:hypothetical protein
MASQFYSDVRGMNAKKRKGAPTGPPGTANAESKGGPLKETTANWPTVGPVWQTSYNRKTKVPVVHTTPKKYGVP